MVIMTTTDTFNLRLYDVIVYVSSCDNGLHDLHYSNQVQLFLDADKAIYTTATARMIGVNTRMIGVNTRMIGVNIYSYCTFAPIHYVF